MACLRSGWDSPSLSRVRWAVSLSWLAARWPEARPGSKLFRVPLNRGCRTRHQALPWRLPRCPLWSPSGTCPVRKVFRRNVRREQHLVPTAVGFGQLCARRWVGGCSPMASRHVVWATVHSCESARRRHPSSEFGRHRPAPAIRVTARSRDAARDFLGYNIFRSSSGRCNRRLPVRSAAKVPVYGRVGWTGRIDHRSGPGAGSRTCPGAVRRRGRHRRG